MFDFHPSRLLVTPDDGLSGVNWSVFLNILFCLDINLASTADVKEGAGYLQSEDKIAAHAPVLLSST